MAKTGYTRAGRGAHPIPGAIMGGAMRQMGRGMPPPTEQVMDIEETVEATRWLMKSNWGPDQNTSPAVATGIILGLRARDLTGKGQPVHITMLNANAWTNADEYYDHANRPPIAMPDEELHGLHALYRLYRCRGRVGVSGLSVPGRVGNILPHCATGRTPGRWPFLYSRGADRPMTKP